MRKIFSLLLTTLISGPISLVTIANENYSNIKESQTNTEFIILPSKLYHYYSEIDNKTGLEIIRALSKSITIGHIPITYKETWDVLNTAFQDKYYDKDDKIIDIYSTVLMGSAPYKFSAKENQCGKTNYKTEGDCYNREHTIPQSLFNKKLPMVADAHHLFPTDGYVNNKRSNHLHGIVTSPTWISKNGSKLGLDNTSATVFEPTNDFKGTVARAYLYFTTRYLNNAQNNKGWLKNEYPLFAKKELDIFKTWADNYPPKEFEIASNNIIYSKQKNRNPFIDIPQLTRLIWNPNYNNSSINLVEKKVA